MRAGLDGCGEEKILCPHRGSKHKQNFRSVCDFRYVICEKELVILE
jgi:hypothetical protein